MAVDNPRALAAFKIGAEGGDALSQFALGTMLSEEGYGWPLDYKQALVWFEKAAAQDDPGAHDSLGGLVMRGVGQQPSWRRARGHLQRAIELGEHRTHAHMQILNGLIQRVTRSHAGNHSGRL